jgi:hypothetical protein
MTRTSLEKSHALPAESGWGDGNVHLTAQNGIQTVIPMNNRRVSMGSEIAQQNSLSMPTIEKHGQATIPQQMGTQSTQEDTSGEEQTRYPRPDGALTLRHKEDGGYKLSVTKIIDEIALEAGDYVFPDYQEQDDGVLFMFSQVDEPDTSYAPGQERMEYKITKATDATTEVSFPTRFVTEELLGVDPDEYDGTNDPIIFLPEFEPGEDYFVLQPLGTASEVFRDIDEFRENPIPQSNLPPVFQGHELEEHTSFTSGETPGPQHLDELNASLSEDHPGDRKAFNPGDAVGISQNLTGEYYFLTPDGWVEMPRLRLFDYLSRVPSEITGSLLRASGYHSGFDPFVVERQGTRYEIHYVEPRTLEIIARKVYHLPLAMAMTLDKTHFETGMQFFQEMYEARDSEPPKDHYAMSGEFAPIILPIGDAQRWPDSEIAVNVDDPERRLQDTFVETETQTEELDETEAVDQDTTETEESAGQAAASAEQDDRDSSGAADDDASGQQTLGEFATDDVDIDNIDL